MPKDFPLFLTDTAKTCLKHTYLQADPRATMRALGRLDYALADSAAPILRQLIAARSLAHRNDVMVTGESDVDDTGEAA